MDCLYCWYWSNNIYNNYDYNPSIKMKDRTLTFLSLVLSGLILLYLLFANLYRDSLIIADWILVSVDLAAKIIIELVILTKKN
jgi:hypothetical protein